MKRTLTQQVKDRLGKPEKPQIGYKGDDTIMISTGSTLLDLAISGGRVRGGGIPRGIFVEVFGPSSTGKTVLLCEVAGDIQRKGGAVMMRDPEARLNSQFARLFGLDTTLMDYGVPNTVPELFKPVREWNPTPAKGVVHGVFADSLAALSTDLEMSKTGDAYGARRAKEFSEELRKTCRVITDKGFLMMCSNQIRQKFDAPQFGDKFCTPGGEAITFYSSLKLRFSSARKMYQEIKSGKLVEKRVIGIQVAVKVDKSSVWKPHRSADIYILYDYGIDDIRANLQYLKQFTAAGKFEFGEHSLAVSMNDSIMMVEDQELETALKNAVISKWEEIEREFSITRKAKDR